MQIFSSQEALWDCILSLKSINNLITAVSRVSKYMACLFCKIEIATYRYFLWYHFVLQRIAVRQVIYKQTLALPKCHAASLSPSVCHKSSHLFPLPSFPFSAFYFPQYWRRWVVLQVESILRGLILFRAFQYSAIWLPQLL